ncbi:hypothetical protein C8Q78DRAFT_993510 [Trametes maxima]|nr:hypothetical protein C8Q78DRAFT_993510 [Trametes maxima]
MSGRNSNTAGPSNSPACIGPLFPDFDTNAECLFCKRKESDLKRKLKRCTGCSVAKYCSKECQKNGWPMHRQGCRPSNGQTTEEVLGADRLAGYPALVTFNNVLLDWKDAHNITLAIMASAIVHLNGSAEPKVLPSRALLFRVIARANNDGGDGNPASAFLVAQPTVVRTTDPEFALLSGGWAGALSECEFEVKSSWAGVIPGALMVQNTGVMMFRCFPVFSYGPRAGRDPRPRAILTDIVRMCVGAVNAGIVLRISAERDNFSDIIAGTLYKRRKKWEWKVEEDWDWSRVISGPTQSGLHPRDVWQQFLDF